MSGTVTGTRVYAPRVDRRESGEVVVLDSPNLGVFLRARLDRIGDMGRKLSTARSSAIRSVKCVYVECKRDEQGSISCQHFEVASDAAPRFKSFRVQLRASVSAVHFSSGMSGASRPRSNVSIGSTGRVMEFGSSKDTSAILSDSSWGVCRRQKQPVER